MATQHRPDDYAGSHDDVQQLHSMGYAQELSRRMSGFSNFAIAWPLSCAFSLIVAAAMGQIASAYPTAGGLYHWASILGGRGFGWSTAWFNMLGLIFVVSSVDVGLWQILFVPLIGQNYLGWTPADFVPDSTLPFGEQLASSAYWVQAVAIAVILGAQALL